MHVTKTYHWKGLHYSLIYSPDDEGFYCDVWDSKGKDQGQTKLLPTGYDAKQAALELIDTLVEQE